VGHILFCPVVIEAGKNRFSAVGLGPMAVLPAFQRRGIGSRLVREGLEQLRKNNHAAVVVLGHPEFYPRFGFALASTYGIRSEYNVPDEAFMAIELLPNGLAAKGGTVVYPREFQGCLKGYRRADGDERPGGTTNK
jgi:putative acetyltransferase